MKGVGPRSLDAVHDVPFRTFTFIMWQTDAKKTNTKTVHKVIIALYIYDELIVQRRDD